MELFACMVRVDVNRRSPKIQPAGRLGDMVLLLLLSCCWLQYTDVAALRVRACGAVVRAQVPCCNQHTKSSGCDIEQQQELKALLQLRV